MSRRRDLPLVLAALAAWGAAPLRAQTYEDEGAAASAAARADALARADSIRATLVRPPGSKGLSRAQLVRLPFRLIGAAVGLAAALPAGLYDTLEGAGVIDFGEDVFRALEAEHLHLRPATIGSRSWPALTLRWDGDPPLFLEGGVSLRGYTLARAGLAFGDTLVGAELAATHHVMNQPHFWGIGPDSDPEDRSDFALTRREIAGSAWIPPVGPLRIGVEGAWVENDVGRGHDAKRPDLQDVFAPDLPFGAIQTTRFVRAGVDVELDLVRMDRNDQQRGGRLRTGWVFHRGVDGTDADFQRASADLGVYLPVSARHAVALRALATDHFAVGGRGVPFFELANLGDEDGLRGYRGHRFRDRAMLAGSAEWRYRVWNHPGDPRYRVDGFVFVDHGAVGSSLGAIGSGDFRTTPGFGLRFVRDGIGILEGFAAFGGDAARLGAGFGSTF